MAVAGTYTPDDLISGEFPLVVRAVMIPAGTPAFKRGAILTAALAPVASGGTPDRVALQDCDASGASAARCLTALTGGFNLNALSTGDSSAPAAFEAALRAKSIFAVRALAE